ncbi:MAG: hypothetical protein COV72_07390 [Candidatus Omnitrophica bacterium CG11_big_fil_rev_8_21_14_0_20_42_13]|uniref:Pilus assembly protein PilO n=1 Tax=Candidatus Ghiorseimicrobium undicola TaxID=1974746 RepID=A0A2H0LW91_9BACT|nr:MAG: hypothetical protein COV72_07390 [Candidatus Omnitrophica bacterium CG11_big_fil_rev_8_21_14_0_20_42_13]
MNMAKEKLTSIIVGGIVIGGIILYFSLFRPLMIDLRLAHHDCDSYDNALTQAYEAMEHAKRINNRKELIDEKGVSGAIDELTTMGKSIGINFTSISLREIESAEDGNFRLLPIDFLIESNYKELALFLGSLERLNKGLVVVESFQISPHKVKPEILNTELTLALCLNKEK